MAGPCVVGEAGKAAWLTNWQFLWKPKQIFLRQMQIPSGQVPNQGFAEQLILTINLDEKH